MNHWIFQSIADRYDLREPKIVMAGKKDTWYATRYKDRMKIGDIVYFWLGGIGEERGIYAVGTVASEAYQKPDWDSYGIDVIYKTKLQTPVTIKTLKASPTLEKLLILRAPQATNFLLSTEEASAIEALARSANHAQ